MSIYISIESAFCRPVESSQYHTIWSAVQFSFVSTIHSSVETSIWQTIYVSIYISIESAFCRPVESSEYAYHSVKPAV